MQIVHPVPDGTTVSYYGTYTELHGLGTVKASYDDWADKSRDGYRYNIKTQNGLSLAMVRRQSFALVSLP